MRTISLFIIFALIIGFSACSKDEPEEYNVPPNENNDNTESGNSSNTSLIGLEAIDLGLSVKWANYNVGATSVEGYGDLFAWGETSTKDSFEREKYQYYHTGYTDKDGIKIDSAYYDRLGNEVFIDYNDKQYSSYDITKTDYDVAHIKWGGKWRIPTHKELRELKDSCIWKWASINNIYGYKVTGKNGNYIFLPASGHGLKEGRKNDNEVGVYISSTLVDQQHLTNSSSTPKEWGFYGIDFSKKEIYFGTHNRIYGYSVRPVSD